MDKHDIGRTMLARRRAMSAEETAEKSAAIAEHLCALGEFRLPRPLLTYVASKDNEVDTRGLIRDQLRQGRTVLVPIAKADGVLAWSVLMSLDEVAPSRFGILEPQSQYQRIAEPLASSVCLVPGIAFTRSGYRVGYGGGYFDRFLSVFSGIAIGLAFELQLVDSFPLDAHDIPVHLLVTEERVYS